MEKGDKMPLDDSAMQAFRAKLSKAIQDVNTDTALTDEQKEILSRKWLVFPNKTCMIF